MKHVFKFILILWTLALVGMLVSCAEMTILAKRPTPSRRCLLQLKLLWVTGIV